MLYGFDNERDGNRPERSARGEVTSVFLKAEVVDSNTIIVFEVSQTRDKNSNVVAVKQQPHPNQTSKECLEVIERTFPLQSFATSEELRVFLKHPQSFYAHPAYGVGVFKSKVDPKVCFRVALGEVERVVDLLTEWRKEKGFSSWSPF